MYRGCCCAQSISYLHNQQIVKLKENRKYFRWSALLEWMIVWVWQRGNLVVCCLHAWNFLRNLSTCIRVLVCAPPETRCCESVARIRLFLFFSNFIPLTTGNGRHTQWAATRKNSWNDRERERKKNRIQSDKWPVFQSDRIVVDFVCSFFHTHIHFLRVLLCRQHLFLHINCIVS